MCNAAQNLRSFANIYVWHYIYRIIYVVILICGFLTTWVLCSARFFCNIGKEFRWIMLHFSIIESILRLFFYVRYPFSTYSTLPILRYIHLRWVIIYLFWVCLITNKKKYIFFILMTSRSFYVHDWLLQNFIPLSNNVYKRHTFISKNFKAILHIYIDL